AAEEHVGARRLADRGAAGAGPAVVAARAEAAARDRRPRADRERGAGAGALALLVAPDLLHDPAAAADGDGVALPVVVADVGDLAAVVVVVAPAGGVLVLVPGVEADVWIGDRFDQ